MFFFFFLRCLLFPSLFCPFSRILFPCEWLIYKLHDVPYDNYIIKRSIWIWCHVHRCSHRLNKQHAASKLDFWLIIYKYIRPGGGKMTHYQQSNMDHHSIQWGHGPFDVIAKCEMNDCLIDSLSNWSMLSSLASVHEMSKVRLIQLSAPTITALTLTVFKMKNPDWQRHCLKDEHSL